MLERAQALAQRAMDAGHHPFGALLVAADHETVLMEQGNVDSVNHAEAVLAREASRRYSPAELWGCTLVTTVEPCAMCAGTQY
ncbi:MAG TPA: nucleoside deaminase, partial [Burkholderiaceae bacterium]|nr:nucleoside deaminase [Burkholderiaceae bacterium]